MLTIVTVCGPSVRMHTAVATTHARARKQQHSSIVSDGGLHVFDAHKQRTNAKYNIALLCARILGCTALFQPRVNP